MAISPSTLKSKASKAASSLSPPRLTKRGLSPDLEGGFLFHPQARFARALAVRKEDLAGLD